MRDPLGQAKRRMFGDRLRLSHTIPLERGTEILSLVCEETGLKSSDGLRRPIVAAAISVATCMCKRVYEVESQTPATHDLRSHRYSPRANVEVFVRMIFILEPLAREVAAALTSSPPHRNNWVQWKLCQHRRNRTWTLGSLRGPSSSVSTPPFGIQSRGPSLKQLQLSSKDRGSRASSWTP